MSSVTVSRGRDWRIAAGLSVIPGAGQVYNRNLRKAAGFFVATLLTIGPAIALITAGESIGHSLLDRRLFTAFLLIALLSVLFFLLLFITGLWFWASAVVDARSSAREQAQGHDCAEQWWFFRL